MLKGKSDRTKFFYQVFAVMFSDKDSIIKLLMLVR